MIKTIFFILALLVLKVCFSQQPYGTRLYTVEDGLPNLEVFSVCQDAKGYIWFGSKQGVTRFDGKEFVTLDKKDGLIYPSITTIFSDNKKRVWLCSYYGDIQYIENNKIHNYRFVQVLKYLRKKSIINMVYQDDSSNIYFGYQRNKIVKINDKTGEFKIYSNIGGTSSTLMFEDRGDAIINDLNNNNLTNYKTEGETELHYKDGKYYVWFSYPTRPYTFNRCVVKIANNEYLASFGRKLIHIKDKKIVREKLYDTDILNMLVDKGHNLWMSVNMKGVFVYSACDIAKEPIPILTNISPGAVIKDFEHNMWIPSSGNGLYLVPNAEFPLLDFLPEAHEKSILQVSIFGDRLFLLSNLNEFFSAKIKNGELTDKQKLIFKGVNQQWITSIFRSIDGTTWLGGTYLVHLSPQGNIIKFYDKLGKITHIDEDKDNLYILRRGYLTILNKKTDIHTDYLITRKPNIDEEIIGDDLLFEPDSSILISTEPGLFCYKNGKVTHRSEGHPFFSKRIKEIFRLNQFYVFATNNGILVWKKNQFKVFNEKNGLSKNGVNTICVDEKTSTIFIGTDKGLCTIQFPDTFLSKAKVSTYLDADGLPVNTILDMKMYEGLLWVGSSKGIFKLDPAKLSKNDNLPRFNYEFAVINDIDTLRGANLFLDYNQNKLEFHFTGFYFRRNEKLLYRYSFDDFKKDIITTRNDYIRLIDLKPGRYTLSVQAGIDGYWKPQYIKIYFFIKEPFTKTYTFWSLLALALLLSVTGISYFLYRINKKRMLLRQKLLQAEQISLQAQMNPHFLYNSMNSLQRYIYESNPEDASNLLVSLSALMRLSFENSTKTLISLNQEFELISTYLDIEKMRFNNDFSFSINLSAQIPTTSLKIPPLLIQPLVENVIWHHLMGKRDNKTVTITANLNRFNYLICKIEDNGIGIDEANKIQKKKSTSAITGLKNTRDRIKILNEFYKTKISIKSYDLYNCEHLSGSVCEILIPLDNFKNIEVLNV